MINDQPWDVSDARQLRAYLTTKSGQKILQLFSERPKLNGENFESTALSAKVQEGWDSLAGQILARSVHQGEEENPESPFVDTSNA